MPDFLRSRIKEIASENRRSMNSEIVLMLEKAVFDPLKKTPERHDERSAA
jgi:hypothetical protein